MFGGQYCIGLSQFDVSEGVSLVSLVNVGVGYGLIFKTITNVKLQRPADKMSAFLFFFAHIAILLSLLTQ